MLLFCLSDPPYFSCSKYSPNSNDDVLWGHGVADRESDGWSESCRLMSSSTWRASSCIWWASSRPSAPESHSQNCENDRTCTRSVLALFCCDLLQLVADFQVVLSVPWDGWKSFCTKWSVQWSRSEMRVWRRHLRMWLLIWSATSSLQQACTCDWRRDQISVAVL